MSPLDYGRVVSRYASVLLSTVLSRTILVAAVLVIIKYAHDGMYGLTAALLLPMLVFVYLRVGDAAALRSRSRSRSRSR